VGKIDRIASCEVFMFDLAEVGTDEGADADRSKVSKHMYALDSAVYIICHLMNSIQARTLTSLSCQVWNALFPNRVFISTGGVWSTAWSSALSAAMTASELPDWR
jgi:hypothetical protein